MNIYYTGNNIKQIKKALEGSNLELIESPKGLFVIGDDGVPKALKLMDQITQVTSEGALVALNKQTNVAMIAAICHEANAAICRCYGDHSQPAWKDAPDWQKNSAINGVLMHLTNPAASPSMSHESWMAEKVADGWVYGEVKDAEAKTHPCIVDYEDLPKEQQSKDYVFRALVHQQAPLSFPGLHLQLASGK